MKKIFYVLLLIGSLLAVSCNEKKYLCGFEFDENQFNEIKAKWDAAGIENYSYTYTRKTWAPVVLDVVVENSELKLFEVKNYHLKTKENTTEKRWNEINDEVELQIKNGGFVLTIDELFETILEKKQLYQDEYENDNTGCYYASIEIKGCEAVPFFDNLSYFRETNTSETNNNSATIISISDFKVLD